MIGELVIFMKLCFLAQDFKFIMFSCSCALDSESCRFFDLHYALDSESCKFFRLALQSFSREKRKCLDLRPDQTTMGRTLRLNPKNVGTFQ